MAESRKTERKQRRLLAKAERLTKAGVAVAKRRNRSDGQPVNGKADVRKMTIQTTPSWMRYMVAALGAFILALGLFVFQSDECILAIILIVFAIGLFAFALVGNRQSLESACRGMGNVITHKIVDTITDSLF